MKRYTNKKHLTYVKSLGCCVCNPDCFGSVQVHHLLKPPNKVRGMGLKASDKFTVPLCAFHHDELHRMGSEYKFSFKYFGTVTQLQYIAECFWLRSPACEQNK